jgi:hypothetical protein
LAIEVVQQRLFAIGFAVQRRVPVFRWQSTSCLVLRCARFTALIHAAPLPEKYRALTRKSHLPGYRDALPVSTAVSIETIFPLAI